MSESPAPARSRTATRLLVAASIASASMFALAACSQAVPLDPATDAKNPDCAAVVVRLPDVLAKGTQAEQPKRETNAQGTGAWGEPASVLLRCGVESPAPTTDACYSVNGVDWIMDESDAPRYRFTTYGRTPAVEVLVDSKVVSGTTVITDLSSAVSVIPADRKCTALGDTPD